MSRKSKSGDPQVALISRHDGEKKFTDGGGLYRTDRFGRLYDSVAQTKKFVDLTPTARYLYVILVMHSGGGCSPFKFPQSAAKLYGFSLNTFWSAIKQLEAAGFIETVRWKTRANTYKLSSRWKL